MYRTLALLVTLAPVAAFADEPVPGGPAPAAPAEAAPAPEERPFDHEISVRGRMMSIPDSLLDIWYFNEKDEGWASDAGRPNPSGYVIGLEYVYKSKKGPNGIFYFDYGQSTMKEG